MAGYIEVKNFTKFQHYRDRTPPWIKLYNDLLEDYDFAALPDATKAHLAMIWLLASRMDNKIPADPRWISNKINATEPVDIDVLVSAGFLQAWSADTAKGKKEEWSSRYIPAPVRASVMERCDNRCVECSATEPLEIDHIIPISKGGTSDEANLQVLCRPCNRRKRVRTSAEHLAPQMRSLEREADREGKEEKELETDTSSVLKLFAGAPQDVEAQINDIMRAANRGMIDNPAIGSLANPIPVSHGSREDVREWLDLAPFEVIQRAVYDRAFVYRPDGRRRQITTMAYFNGAVHDAAERWKATQTQVSDDRTGSGGVGAATQVGSAKPAGRKPDKYAHLVEGDAA